MSGPTTFHPDNIPSDPYSVSRLGSPHLVDAPSVPAMHRIPPGGDLHHMAVSARRAAHNVPSSPPDPLPRTGHGLERTRVTPMSEVAPVVDRTDQELLVGKLLELERAFELAKFNRTQAMACFDRAFADPRVSFAAIDRTRENRFLSLEPKEHIHIGSKEDLYKHLPAIKDRKRLVPVFNGRLVLGRRALAPPTPPIPPGAPVPTTPVTSATTTPPQAPTPPGAPLAPALLAPIGFVLDPDIEDALIDLSAKISDLITENYDAIMDMLAGVAQQKQKEEETRSNSDPHPTAATALPIRERTPLREPVKEKEKDLFPIGFSTARARQILAQQVLEAYIALQIRKEKARRENDMERAAIDHKEVMREVLHDETRRQEVQNHEDRRDSIR